MNLLTKLIKCMERVIEHFLAKDMHRASLNASLKIISNKLENVVITPSFLART